MPLRLGFGLLALFATIVVESNKCHAQIYYANVNGAPGASSPPFAPTPYPVAPQRAWASTPQSAWIPISSQAPVQVYKASAPISSAPVAAASGARAPGWPYYVDVTYGWDAPRAPIAEPPVASPAPPWAPRIISSQPWSPAAPVATSPMQQPAPETQPVVKAQPVGPPTPPPSTPIKPQPPPETKVADIPKSETSDETTSQVLADHRIAPGDGHEWREYDISEYTRQFPESASAENAVRQWILAETGMEVWHGLSLASLLVTPNLVKVYHNDQVQQQVADILGRFKYYIPGEFHCRVTTLNVTDGGWRGRFQARLLEAEAKQPGREAWYLDRADAYRLENELSDGRNGILVANPAEFSVANGQWAKVNVALRPGGESTRPVTARPATAGDGKHVSVAQDGIIVRFSPLVGLDAASVDVDFQVDASRLTPADSSGALRNGAAGDVPEISEFAFGGMVRLAPGKVILLSMGLVPSFDPKMRGKDARAELLIMIELQPDPRNTVSGTPIASIAPAAAPTMQSMASPSTQFVQQTVARPTALDARGSVSLKKQPAAPPTRSSRPTMPNVPAELTRAVFN